MRLRLRNGTESGRLKRDNRLVREDEKSFQVELGLGLELEGAGDAVSRPQEAAMAAEGSADDVAGQLAASQTASETASTGI